MSLLAIANISASYGRTPALREISFEVNEGDALFVVGPNGAGKSTLVQTIIGAHPTATGSVSFRGVPITGHPVEVNVRAGLCLVPEGRHVFASMSVAENLRLAKVATSDHKQFEEDEARILALFPILRARYRGPAGILSGGEQQQLAIARALVQRPTLLMVDEPSLGLAPMVTDGIYDILRSLQATGLTLLVVEQSTSRIKNIANRVLVLKNGRLAAERAVKTDSDIEAIEELYFAAN